MDLSTPMRFRLRRMLKVERPSGEAITPVESLFSKVAKFAKCDQLYPGDVLSDINLWAG